MLHDQELSQESVSKATNVEQVVIEIPDRMIDANYQYDTNNIKEAGVDNAFSKQLQIIAKYIYENSYDDDYLIPYLQETGNESVYTTISRISESKNKDLYFYLNINNTSVQNQNISLKLKHISVKHLFPCLPDSLIANLCSFLVEIKLTENLEICLEQLGSCLLLVTEGTVLVQGLKSTTSFQLNEGDSFGSYSMLKPDTLSSSYKLIADRGTVGLINEKNLDFFLGYYNHIVKKRFEIINSIPLIKFLPAEVKVRLGGMLRLTTLKKDQVIVENLSDETIVFQILEGSLIDQDSSHNDLTSPIFKKDSINYEILYKKLDLNRKRKYVACEETCLASIKLEQIMQSVDKSSLQDLIDYLIVNAFNLGCHKSSFFPFANYQRVESITDQLSNKLPSKSFKLSSKTHLPKEGPAKDYFPQKKKNSDYSSENQKIRLGDMNIDEGNSYPDPNPNLQLKSLNELFKLFSVHELNELDSSNICLLLNGKLVDHLGNPVELLEFVDLSNLKYKAEGRVIVLAKPLPEKKENKGISQPEVISCYLINSFFSKLGFANTLSSHSLQILGSYVVLEDYMDGEVIKQVEVKISKFYYVVNGCISACDSHRNTSYISDNDAVCFPLLNGQAHKFSCVRVVSKGRTRILSLSIDKIISTLSSKYVMFHDHFYHNCPDMESLRFISNLGSGSFGVVYLAQYEQTNYAIKCISHDDLVKSSILRNYLLNEITLLNKVRSPFVCSIYEVRYDSKFIYLLLEYNSSITLRWMMQNRGDMLNLSYCKETFFQLLVGIKQMHKLSIIHRDIKPDNIVVITDCTLKMIDLGISKQLKNFTSTVIGTSSYMSPEVVKGEPYGTSVDIWSIGVTIFEMLFERLPFYSSYKDLSVMDIYKRIIKGSTAFPSFYQSRFIGDPSLLRVNEEFNRIVGIIKGMLEPKMSKRLIKLDEIKRFFKVKWSVINDLHFKSGNDLKVDTMKFDVDLILNKKDAARMKAGLSLKSFDGLSYGDFHKQMKNVTEHKEMESSYQSWCEELIKIN